jgi:uncharacterized protein YggE
VTSVVKTIGVASREVEPDRVSVSVLVKTQVHESQQRALRRALEVRGEISAGVRARFPEARVSDSRVYVEEHHVRREMQAERRIDTEVLVGGYYGVCTVTVDDAAERAVEIVAAIGAGDEYSARPPTFSLSDAVRTAVVSELECEAVRYARVQAERLASAADCTLGAVLTIGEDAPPETRRGHSEGVHLRTFAPIDDDPERAELIGEIRPEPINVRAAVPVRFALVPR